jgi:hypothetical protein
MYLVYIPRMRVQANVYYHIRRLRIPSFRYSQCPTAQMPIAPKLRARNTSAFCRAAQPGPKTLTGRRGRVVRPQPNQVKCFFDQIGKFFTTQSRPICLIYESVSNPSCREAVDRGFARLVSTLFSHCTKIKFEMHKGAGKPDEQLAH